MTNEFDSCLASCEQLLTQASKEIETYIPPVNHDKMRVNKATVQHDIEQKVRELVKTLKKVKDEHERAKKELNLKQQSVNSYYKSGEQLESRLTRAIEAHEKRVKREQEKKALISSVFDFIEDVGLHFNVCQSSEDSNEPSIFKIGFSHIDPDDTKKVFSLKIETTSEMIKVLEADAADEEFKNLEKTFNENFKTTYLPIFINRARKIFLNYIKSNNQNKL